MQYTKFGSTGIDVSRLGFGCMRLPTLDSGAVDEEAAIAMLREGYSRGVNYFDTAYVYHDGKSEVVLGKALKGIRDKVQVSTKILGWMLREPGDYRRKLEEQLRRLDTDYIDFYHFHCVDYDLFTETDKKFGWYKEAQKAKDEGLIRHISVSYHAPNKGRESDDLIKLIDTDYFETVLCQYNMLDRTNERGIEYAKNKGLGVVIMGPLGGGRVSGLPKEVSARLGIKTAASAELGLRFVVANPNVDIILSGMSSMQQLVENAECVANSAPLSKEELDGVTRMMEENARLSDLYCTGCNYCMPCPKEVNIPTIFTYANYYKVYGIEDYARGQYRDIGKAFVPGKRADACVDCGACEKKCPQHIKIREQLKEAHRLLGA